MDWFTPESEPSGSGDLVNPVFRAQPEHAICKSRPAGTAKNYHSPGDAERPPNVRMTVDKDSRDSEPHTQRHTQAAIHSPQIQNRCHGASPFPASSTEILPVQRCQAAKRDTTASTLIHTIVTVCTRWIRRIASGVAICATEAIHNIMALHSHASLAMDSAPACVWENHVAAWRTSSSLHLCSTNCLRRLSCASDVLLRESSGTLKFLSQCVQMPTAGTVPSHFVTLNLRWDIVSGRGLSLGAFASRCAPSAFEPCGPPNAEGVSGWFA